MSFGAKLSRSELLNRSKGKLRDPITGEQAWGEVELSALLALKHNWGEIEWQKVPFNRVSDQGETVEVPGSLFHFEELIAQCEYPLFSEPRTSASDSWGGFRADVLFMHRSSGRLIYVENKIGDKLKTHFIKGVLKCLDSQKSFEKPSFAILTGRKFKENGWYVGELKQVLRENPKLATKVESYIFYWEDLIEACAND